MEQFGNTVQEKFDGHQQFFAIVQLIGTRKQAENFAYRYPTLSAVQFIIEPVNIQTTIIC